MGGEALLCTRRARERSSDVLPRTGPASQPARPERRRRTPAARRERERVRAHPINPLTGVHHMTSFFSSPKARRLGLLLALCFVIEASAPAPALAWFGWLDKWSGPGPFWGQLYRSEERRVGKECRSRWSADH